MTEGSCSIEGCDKARYQASRMCVTHKMRKHRYGDPLAEMSRAGRTWTTDNGYEKRAVPVGSPLGDHQGAAAVHRIRLYETIGPGSHACHWCGTAVTWQRFLGSWRGVLVVDHLDGDKGNNHVSNLVPSCFSCNALRGRWSDESVIKRRKAS